MCQQSCANCNCKRSKEDKKDNINFVLTREQADMVCQVFGFVDSSDKEDWEICELLDSIIDNAYVARC